VSDDSGVGDRNSDESAASGNSNTGDIDSGSGGGSGSGSAQGGGRPATKQSLWTRSFIIISLVNLLNAIVFLLLVIVMSTIATDRFGASPAVAGLAVSIFVIGSFITRPFLGKRMHFIGQTRVLYIGSFFSLILTLAYFAVNSIGLLLLVRFLHGAAHATTALAAGTIVAGVVPRERYGEGIGYFTLGQTLSTAIGPFVGLLLLRYGGFNPIIITSSVLLAISLAVIPFLGAKDLVLTAEQRAETQGFKLSNYIEPKAVPVCVALGLSYLCQSSVSSFLALYSEAVQLTAAAGVFFIVYAIVIFVTRPSVGRRFDAKGENSVMYPGILIFAVSLGVIAVAFHSVVLLLGAALMGFGFGIVSSCGRALTVKVTPLHRMGQATSTFYIAGDTGLGLGPLFCGLLIPWTGYRGMYGVMAGVAVLSLLLYHALHGRHAGGGASADTSTSERVAGA
jgi:MFS family permease